MEVYERIKNRRKELGLSADNVADALGVSRATIYRYESADIEKLPTTILEPLSKILHCSPAYLMGWSETTGYELPKESNDVTLSEFEHIRRYRDLDPHGREMVDIVLQKEYERCKPLKSDTIPSLHIVDEAELNAAHERPDASLEDQEADNAMMDDEKF